MVELAAVIVGRVYECKLFFFALIMIMVIRYAEITCHGMSLSKFIEKSFRFHHIAFIPHAMSYMYMIPYRNYTSRIKRFINVGLVQKINF